MKIARITSPQQFEFLEVPDPEIGEGEVLVKMERLSICGSDLRIFDRTFDEEMYPIEHGKPCHECAGVVVETKSSEYNVGDKVIVFPDGGNGLAEYLSEPAERLVRLPDGKDMSTLLMCQPVGTVMHSCKLTGNVIGKKIVVLGQGPIGLSFSNILAQGGATKVIGVDLLDYRLDVAKNNGATHVINPNKDNLEEAVAELTNGEGADIVVEAAGRPETLNGIWKIIKKQGKAILFGLSHDEDIFELNFDEMTSKLPVIEVHNSARTWDMPQAVSECIELVEQNRLDLSYLVTHNLKFEEVQKAYETYSSKLDNSLKITIEL